MIDTFFEQYDLEPACVSLWCLHCGFVMKRDREAMHRYTGQRIGCPGCGISQRVPPLTREAACC